jgi:hypothetical protein
MPLPVVPVIKCDNSVTAATIKTSGKSTIHQTMQPTDRANVFSFIVHPSEPTIPNRTRRRN